MNSELKNLITLGEGYHLELKESVDKSFIEEVCDFVNSSGGKIILGVNDKGEIKGIKTDNNFRSKVQDIINQLEPALNGIKITIDENIIIVDIPQGTEKPYACSKGFFIRIGPNSQKLRRNEIITFFQKEGRIRFDELENSKADYKNDFNEEAFEHFIELAGISKSIKKDFLLKNLNCLTEEQTFTNAGVLFFTKSLDFIMNHATVVCVLYKGNKKVHIIDKKDFHSDLITNIEHCLQFVQRNINLEFKIEKLRREEIYEIPEVALREAIVNAVCHRDYFQHGANVLIEVFDNRVDISNPGGLPTNLPPADFGTKSVVRNPVLASLLLRADYIEKIGTGIARIREAVDGLGKGTVSFTFTTFFTVSFSRAEKAKDTVEKSSQKGSQKTVEKILKEVKINPKTTIKELETKTGLSRRGIEWNIAKLKNSGKLKRIGPDKGGHWEVQ
ncbi:MAG: putative DNA binding domain-containing protein [Kiritimatiellae bacterium]|nr:putative DNA binding domain-containing protein [Kiritimatiellia bacterium]